MEKVDSTTRLGPSSANHVLWGRRSDEPLAYFILIDCFELSFVMAEVGNLHAKLGGSHGLHTWFTRFTWYTPLGPLISNRNKIVR